MNKYFLRAVALFLVPCLTVDPAAASVIALRPSPINHPPAAVYLEQAFDPRSLNVHPSALIRHYAFGDKSFAGRLTRRIHRYGGDAETRASVQDTAMGRPWGFSRGYMEIPNGEPSGSGDRKLPLPLVTHSFSGTERLIFTPIPHQEAVNRRRLWSQLKRKSIQHARHLLRYFGVVKRPTSLLEYSGLNDFVSNFLGHPIRILLKNETESPTGSFKDRSPIRLYDLVEKGRPPQGVETVSTGNHGRASSHAVRLVKHIYPELADRLYSRVTMGKGALLNKKQLIRAEGAILREHTVTGEEIDSYLSAEQMVEAEVAASRGRIIQTPHADPQVVAGYATIAQEILEQLEEKDIQVETLRTGQMAMLSSLGSGGLFAGLLEARALYPQIDSYGASAHPADMTYRSLQTGTLVRESHPSGDHIAVDGNMATPAPYALPLIREMASGILKVTDEDALYATAILAHYGLLVEATTGLEMAALLLHGDLFARSDFILAPITSINLGDVGRDRIILLSQNIDELQSYFERRRREIETERQQSALTQSGITSPELSTSAIEHLLRVRQADVVSERAIQAFRKMPAPSGMRVEVLPGLPDGIRLVMYPTDPALAADLEAIDQEEGLRLIQVPRGSIGEMNVSLIAVHEVPALCITETHPTFSFRRKTRDDLKSVAALQDWPDRMVVYVQEATRQAGFTSLYAVPGSLARVQNPELGHGRAQQYYQRPFIKAGFMEEFVRFRNLFYSWQEVEASHQHERVTWQALHYYRGGDVHLWKWDVNEPPTSRMEKVPPGSPLGLFDYLLSHPGLWTAAQLADVIGRESELKRPLEIKTVKADIAALVVHMELARKEIHGNESAYELYPDVVRNKGVVRPVLVGLNHSFGARPPMAELQKSKGDTDALLGRSPEADAIAQEDAFAQPRLVQLYRRINYRAHPKSSIEPAHLKELMGRDLASLEFLMDVIERERGMGWLDMSRLSDVSGFSSLFNKLDQDVKANVRFKFISGIPEYGMKVILAARNIDARRWSLIQVRLNEAFLRVAQYSGYDIRKTRSPVVTSEPEIKRETASLAAAEASPSVSRPQDDANQVPLAPKTDVALAPQPPSAPQEGAWRPLIRYQVPGAPRILITPREMAIVEDSAVSAIEQALDMLRPHVIEGSIYSVDAILDRYFGRQILSQEDFLAKLEPHLNEAKSPSVLGMVQAAINLLDSARLRNEMPPDPPRPLLPGDPYFENPITPNVNALYTTIAKSDQFLNEEEKSALIHRALVLETATSGESASLDTTEIGLEGLFSSIHKIHIDREPYALEIPRTRDTSSESLRSRRSTILHSVRFMQSFWRRRLGRFIPRVRRGFAIEEDPVGIYQYLEPYSTLRVKDGKLYRWRAKAEKKSEELDNVTAADVLTQIIAVLVYYYEPEEMAGTTLTDVSLTSSDFILGEQPSDTPDIKLTTMRARMTGVGVPAFIYALLHLVYYEHHSSLPHDESEQIYTPRLGFFVPVAITNPSLVFAGVLRGLQYRYRDLGSAGANGKARRDVKEWLRRFSETVEGIPYKPAIQAFLEGKLPPTFGSDPQDGWPIANRLKVIYELAKQENHTPQSTEMNIPDTLRSHLPILIHILEERLRELPPSLQTAIDTTEPPHRTAGMVGGTSHADQVYEALERLHRAINFKEVTDAFQDYLMALMWGVPEAEQPDFEPVLEMLVQALRDNVLPKSINDLVTHPAVLISKTQMLARHRAGGDVLNLRTLQRVAYDEAIHSVPLLAVHQAVVVAMWQQFNNFDNHAMKITKGRADFIENSLGLLRLLSRESGKEAHRLWHSSPYWEEYPELPKIAGMVKQSNPRKLLKPKPLPLQRALISTAA